MIALIALLCGGVTREDTFESFRIKLAPVELNIMEKYHTPKHTRFKRIMNPRERKDR